MTLMLDKTVEYNNHVFLRQDNMMTLTCQLDKKIVLERTEDTTTQTRKKRQYNDMHGLHFVENHTHNSYKC